MNTNITIGTIARTIALLVALLNQVCAIMGCVPFDLSEETIYQLVSLAATTITAVAAWWKNNSFTRAAVEADKAMRTTKSKETMNK